jgi:hypothetical protein
MDLRIHVTGDPDGGWIVDLHDGDKQGTYRPTAGTVQEAAIDAINEHFPQIPAQGPMPPAELGSQAPD